MLFWAAQEDLDGKDLNRVAAMTPNHSSMVRLSSTLAGDGAKMKAKNCGVGSLGKLMGRDYGRFSNLWQKGQHDGLSLPIHSGRPDRPGRPGRPGQNRGAVLEKEHDDSNQHVGRRGGAKIQRRDHHSNYDDVIVTYHADIHRMSKK